MHKEYEDAFWGTKMALPGWTAAQLASTKAAYDAFLADPKRLEAVRAELPKASTEQAVALHIVEKSLGTYAGDDGAAAELRDRISVLEAELAQARNGMELGYYETIEQGAGGEEASADGAEAAGSSDASTKKRASAGADLDASATKRRFVPASSVQLRNRMRMSDLEADRRSAYEGLRTIGPFVAERFAEIARLRNRMARAAGYANFYDMKVQRSEGFDLERLFGMLDGLEERTRPLLERTLADLASKYGEEVLKPWNTSHALSGDVEAELDPYFPFEKAVDVWARTFAALGIKYRGSTLTLDLCDRPGKYSNGFCHWPVPAFRTAEGEWVAAKANFTSLADPSAKGSGRTALITLLHEGGHAAHFANVDQRTPLASQERAPTSVAYAENQSMFLDSLATDADWLAKYARDRDGKPVPWELVERSLRASHPVAVLAVRSMLSVPYFEKALYELPEEEVTPERILELADETERRIEGRAAPRPLMSVPHILADESSGYYHGYVLAEMGVHQARAHFLKAYGKLADEPRVGEDLTRVYWRPGNAAAFLDLVERLTSKPLAADAWVDELNEPLEDKVAAERASYDRGVAEGPKFSAGTDVDLEMRVRLVHGETLIGDSVVDGGLAGACAKFEAWIPSLKTQAS